MKIQFQSQSPVHPIARRALRELEENGNSKLVDSYVMQLASAPEGPHSLPSRWAMQVRAQRPEQLTEVALRVTCAGLQGPAAAVLAHLAQQVSDQPLAVSDTLELIRRVGDQEESSLAEYALYDYGLTSRQRQQAQQEALQGLVSGQAAQTEAEMSKWLPNDWARRLAADDYHFEN